MAPKSSPVQVGPKCPSGFRPVLIGNQELMWALFPITAVIPGMDGLMIRCDPE